MSVQGGRRAGEWRHGLVANDDAWCYITGELKKFATICEEMHVRFCTLSHLRLQISNFRKRCRDTQNPK